ncbi:MAG: hypothetical protein LC789_06255 [Actinobacteria bacterium]|nr:hypothetical protein [Actinomycetota bacterium]MCA1722226.1 hypothetical protein [Actinomycetota bacterium]
MSPRRPLPSGIRRRGAVFTYTWRDERGRQFSRKAGDTLAEAFKRTIVDQLALGSYRPASTITFGVYATSWIEIAPLKEQTRYGYRSILRRHLIPAFGALPLAKIHPHHVRSWVAELNASRPAFGQHHPPGDRGAAQLPEGRPDRRAHRRPAAPRRQGAAHLLPPAGRVDPG